MGESLSDFSKILELQEIKQSYDELQERHRTEIAERDAELEHLRSQVDLLGNERAGDDAEAELLRQENERLAQQIHILREEYDSRIERLNSRVRDLSEAGARSADPADDRKSFFRR
jgi:peptidoglycan hydrolase CwlO-like protein